jgi:hypothetical protein
MKNLFKIREDHFKHLIAGYGITLISSAMLVQVIGSLWATSLGISIGILVGIAKELVYDKWMERGTPELSDVYWTTAGSFTAGLPQFINCLL